MYLQNLKLSQFRSYGYLDISFSQKTNIICGKNAQGKTNIIEAIHYFSTLKSHRFVSDKELILTGQDSAQLQIAYQKEGASSRLHKMKIGLSKSAKRELYHNDIKEDNASFLGEFHSVLFSPEDLNLIKGDKEQRRKFLDADVCQIRPRYYKILKYYNSILRNRNKLLKEDSPDPTLLQVYTDRLVEFGTEVIIYRALFVERLKETAKKIYGEIANGNETLTLRYESELFDEFVEDRQAIREYFHKKLEEVAQEERLFRTTRVGPHRDDLEFFLDDKNVKIYASQGQQRTIILALKLSELIFIKELTGSYPVLLLDDILSELDRERQESLFSYIKNCQTIITITDAQKFEVEGAKTFSVDHSVVTEL